jgi:hypothetical protein
MGLQKVYLEFHYAKKGEKLWKKKFQGMELPTKNLVIHKLFHSEG